MSNMDIVIPAHKANKRRALWLVLAILAVIAVLFFVVSGFGAGRVLQTTQDNVTLHSVTDGEFIESVSVLAMVEPVRSVVLSTAVGGRLEPGDFLSGSHVEQGDEIARLTNAALELEVLTRATEVAQQISNLYNFELAYQNRDLDLQNQKIAVESDLAKAQLRLERVESLVAKGFSTQEAYDNARIDVREKKTLRDTIAAAVVDFQSLKASQSSDFKETTDKLTAGLALARKRQDDLVIRAPISGILSDFDAIPGTQIQAGDVIGRIKSVDRMILRANPSEFYLNKIDSESKATALVGDRSYPLRLVKLSPTVANKTFEVDFELLDSGQTVRLGQTVPIRIQLSSPRQAIQVPASPFWNGVGPEGVFVYDPETKRAVRRQVTLGSRNDTAIEIRHGLNDGDIVVGLNYEEMRGYERIEIE